MDENIYGPSGIRIHGVVFSWDTIETILREEKDRANTEAEERTDA
jgi:hypothetical protein